MTDLTIDAIQALYFKTKDEVAELSKRHGAEMKPFADRLELCKNWMAKFLTDTGQESAKTEHGLTYKSNILQCSVEGDNGWEKLLEYIFERAINRVLDAVEQRANNPTTILLQEPALELLNRSVNKTAVKTIMEQQEGFVPPGVKVGHVVQINVRRN